MRGQHNSGYKHKSNVKSYYLQFEEGEQARLIAELNGFAPPVSPACLLPDNLLASNAASTLKTNQTHHLTHHHHYS